MDETPNKGVEVPYKGTNTIAPDLPTPPRLLENELFALQVPDLRTVPLILLLDLLWS